MSAHGGTFATGGAAIDVAIPSDGAWKSRVSADLERQGFKDDRTSYGQAHALLRTARVDVDRKMWLTADLSGLRQSPASPHAREGPALSTAVPLDGNYNPNGAYIDQDRVAGMKFAGAGFTNLTGDHLNYHKTMEHYAAAKAKLFSSLDESAVAVLNAADDWSAWMERKCKARIIRFGFGTGKEVDYQAREVSMHAGGSNFVLVTPEGSAAVNLAMIGRHNIENALLAAALAGETCGLSAQEIAAGLTTAAGAPGRLQSGQAGQPFSVLVDYAHTDDALENVLSAFCSVAAAIAMRPSGRAWRKSPAGLPMSCI